MYRSTFVRGEDCLQAWKPRGVSLVEDYYRLVETETALAEVATTQAVLAAIPPSHLASAHAGHDDQGRRWDALQLWTKRFGTSTEVGA
jgi:kinesin family protein 1